MMPESDSATPETAQQRGTSYENFVAEVYAAIHRAEARDGRIEHVTLDKRKRVVGAGGNPNEIDIYWEYRIASIVYRTAIECKAYAASTVPVGDMRDFAYKLQDIGGVKGVFVTQNGYQSGAVTVARNNSIDLISIREVQPGDMNGFLESIVINMTLIHPAQTTDIIPMFDGPWMVEQGYQEGQSLQIRELNRDIVLEDRADGFERSMLRLEEERFHSDEVGAGEWTRDFTDGWLNVGEQSFKVRSVTVKYVNPQDTTEMVQIDLTQHVLAIMEHIDHTLGRTRRVAVSRDGNQTTLEDDEV